MPPSPLARGEAWQVRVQGITASSKFNFVLTHVTTFPSHDDDAIPAKQACTDAQQEGEDDDNPRGTKIPIKGSGANSMTSQR
jgi:hypothetical protein